MIRFFYRYQVNGMGSFPIDMLRYDSAWPYQEVDAGIIAERMEHTKRTDNAPVNLRSIQPPTAGRWESFMWRIVGPVEKVPAG